MTHGVGRGSGGRDGSSASPRIRGGSTATLPSAVSMVDVSKEFGAVRALSSAELDVAPGEIHGLLGENGAGKTTLMNVLYGLVHPDSGRISVAGRRAAPRSPKDAISLGIGMVHQHFMLVPDMTVAENVSLGLPSRRPPLSPVPEVRGRIVELAARYCLRVGADDLVEDLPVGMQQRVELLKLLYRNARVLILDEPTSILTPAEWQDLAAVLRALAAEGRAVILITHKLHEILDVTDRCTVLRDGRTIGTVRTADVTEHDLARMTVGRDVVLRVERPVVQPGPPVLQVSGLTLTRPDGRRVLDGIDITIHAGEIVGVAGVEGNGQQELVDVLTGVTRPNAGRVSIGGAGETVATPLEFVRRGGAVVPADRHRMAVALDLSVSDNLMMREFRQAAFVRGGMLRRAAIAEHCRSLVADYAIRTESIEAPVRLLSGGNQQRVVLARELSRHPRLLIAAQPTRGLDVGAIEQVYARVLAHKQAGGAVLLISSELEEVLTLSDRVAVIVAGRFLRVLDAADADLATVGLLMGGVAVDDGRP
jgi:ABC-type uncharacterized transport system ATPase subunit